MAKEEFGKPDKFVVIFCSDPSLVKKLLHAINQIRLSDSPIIVGFGLDPAELKFFGPSQFVPAESNLPLRQQLPVAKNSSISDGFYPLRTNIYVYDALAFLVDAVKTSAHNLPPSIGFRARLLAALKSSSFVGYSGPVFLDEEGFRLPNELVKFDLAGSEKKERILQSCADASGEVAKCDRSLNSERECHTERVAEGEAQVTTWPLGFIRTITLVDPMMNFTLSIVNNHSNHLLPETAQLAFVSKFDHQLPAGAILAAQAIQQVNPVGVIGPLDNTRAVAAQNMLGFFNIPELSPAASVADLSTKSLYPTFLRNSIQDPVTAQAIIGTLLHFGWNRFALISSNDNYGVGVGKVVSTLATEHKMRILGAIAVVANQTDMDEALVQAKNRGARIVVFASITPVFPSLISSMARVGFRPKAVVASDTFLSDGLPSLPDVPSDFFNGWLTVNPPSPHGPFYDFILTQYNALTTAQKETEFGGNLTAAITSPKTNIGATLDSVFIYADALTRMLKAGLDPRNGTAMYHTLLQTNLTLTTGETTFNSVGDRQNLPYDIRNIRNGSISLVARFIPIGTNGTYQSLQTVVFPDNSTTVPSDVAPRTPTWLHWNNGGAITMSILAGLGILVVFGLLILIVKKRASPIILSSTWQFLILMLFGAALGYGSVYLWIGRPQAYICALRIWLPAIAFILILAPLLAKTWRLHRIFTLGSLKIAPIPLWKLSVFAGVLIAIQVVICIFWISFGSIKPIEIPNTDNETESFAVCEQLLANHVCTWVTFGFLGICLIIGAYYAFRVRNLPKEFNESRWIGFCIYNSILFGILAIILGYTLTNFVVTVLILICVCTWAIATGCICFMMAPKIWVLIRNSKGESTNLLRFSRHGNASNTAAVSTASTVPTVSTAPTGPIPRRHDYSLPTKNSSFGSSATGISRTAVLGSSTMDDSAFPPAAIPPADTPPRKPKGHDTIADSSTLHAS